MKSVNVFVDGPYDGGKDPATESSCYPSFCIRQPTSMEFDQMAIYEYVDTQFKDGVSHRRYRFNIILPAKEAHEFLEKHSVTLTDN
ncbi:MAG: hypothetical protein SFX18_00535 [Pirellulales bacterium]|nr:hypothetical protein [Pirellulales bacterium]